jgi:hypothetical protein
MAQTNGYDSKPVDRSGSGLENCCGNERRDIDPEADNRDAALHVAEPPEENVRHMAASKMDIPDEFYNKYTRGRKVMIVALLSYCAFLAAISSTSPLSATPEIAEEFHTSGSVVNLSSALYILLMGVSPMVLGPLSPVFGRRMVGKFDSTLRSC